MPYKDLAEHTSVIVVLLGTMSGIAGFLLWKLRSSDKHYLEQSLSSLRDEVYKTGETMKDCFVKIEKRFDSCQEVQKMCPFRYAPVAALKEISDKLDVFHRQIDQDRKEAWKEQAKVNSRQEAVNLAIMKMLSNHTHDGSGKPIGIVDL